MKFILSLVLTTLSAATGSFALADDGIAGATAQCNRISDGNLRLQCTVSVSRANQFSESAINQCARLNDATLLAKCIGNISGFSDDGAVAQCGRINDGTILVQCLGAVSGKTYRPEDIAACSRYNDANGIVNCFSQLGRGGDQHEHEHHPHPAPGPGPGPEGPGCGGSKQRVKQAIQQIQSGNSAQAVYLLQDLAK